MRLRLSPGAPEGLAAKIKAAGGEELLSKVVSRRTTGGGASATDVSLDLHGRNIAAIFKAWDEGQEAETGPAEARKAVAIIQAMYESVRRKGAAVDVR